MWRLLAPCGLLLASGCLAIAGLDSDYVLGDAASSAGNAWPTGSGAAAPNGGSGGASNNGGASSNAGASSNGGASNNGGAGGTGGTPGPVCGNLVPEANEECDDGNTLALDGCSATCTIENPDSCSAAPIIVISTQDMVVVAHDTTGAIDDVTTSTPTPECGMGIWYGGDHVWAVVPQANGSLFVALTASFSSHYLHMRSACPGSVDLGCDYAASSLTIDDFTVPVQMGQTYFIIVDSYANTGGTYTLNVSLN